MQQTKKYLSYAVLVAWLMALVLGLWMYQQECDRTSAFTEAGFEIGLGGNDWVTWEDSPQGVRVQKVHPLIQSNSRLDEQYLAVGDLLRKIDYQDIFQAETVEEIVRHAAPGSVLLFQVERKDPLSGQARWTNLFIETSFDTPFSFTGNHGLWALFPWMAIVGSFLSLLSMLIIFPIIRSRLRKSFVLFGVIALSFLAFLTMLVRHLNLLVSNDLSSVDVERTFVFVFLVVVVVHGMMAIYSRMRALQRWFILPGLAIGGWFLYQSFVHLFGPSYAYFGEATEEFTLYSILVNVFGILLHSALEKWKGRSGLDKAFHLLSFVYTGGLLLYCGLVFSGVRGNEGEEWAMFLALGAILIPMISATASQLKFGKISVVLTSSLQYIIFGMLALLLYYWLHRSLISLGLQFKYQNYLELVALILVMLALRAIYKANEGRLRQYFVLAQQEKRDRIDGFIARISQYTSSQRLMDDLVSALQDYFGAGQVAIWMKDEPGAGARPGMEQPVLESIFQELQQRQAYWARNRQMNLRALPESVEQPLVKSPFAFANAITVNDNIYGLLLISHKRRGVYNLEDLEIISRIIQQTQLTQGVLHLLEREKLLIKQNYEANLTALRSQINPHFLFNTLNTISALIHDAPDEAEIAVEKLAFIFRYTLKHSDRAFVTLKEEMSLVQTYLEIEEIRFGARLEVQLDMQREMMEVELPAFVVQTIVENAIKHGIAKIMGKGIVAIRSWEEAGFMHCSIEDNGPGIQHEKITTSTGLNNITTRLDQIYEKKNLLYFENTGNGTRVTIKIPLQK